MQFNVGRSTNRQKRIWSLGLLSSGHGVAHWYMGILPVLYPILALELGLNYSQIGLFDSARGAVGVVISLVGGYLADVFGMRRWFLSFSLISLGICTALLSSSETYYGVLLLLALGGIGNSLWHPYALPMLKRMFPQRRSLATAIHDAGANSFHGIAPIVVGMLLGFLSWRYVVSLHLWPGLLMGIVIIFAMPKSEGLLSKKRTGATYNKSWRSGILSNRAFLTAGSVSACLTMGRLALFAFLPLFLAFELGLDSPSQGVYIGVMTIAGAIMAPVTGNFSDRFGIRVILITTIAIATVCVVTLAFAESGIMLYIILALLGVALFSTRSLLLVFAMSVTPDEMGGSSVGAIFSTNRLFGVLSPIIAGFIGDTVGLRPVFYFIGSLLFAGVLLLVFMNSKKLTLST